MEGGGGRGMGERERDIERKRYREEGDEGVKCVMRRMKDVLGQSSASVCCKGQTDLMR